MKLPSNEQLAQIRADFPPRTRVVLEYMDDPYAPPVGTHGTVITVDSLGDLIMRWDNGSGLNVCLEVDRVRKEDSINMSDGSKLKLWGLSPFATVNYTETNNTLDTYKVKVGTAAEGTQIQGESDVVGSGTLAAWSAAHAVADSYTISTTATLNADADAVYYTNTLNEISPTGYVARFAPYALDPGRRYRPADHQ